MANREPFYGKFLKKEPLKQTRRPLERSSAVQSQRQAAEDTDAVSIAAHTRRKRKQVSLKRSIPYTFGDPVFSELSSDAKQILSDIPVILKTVLPLDSKKQQALSLHIHELFHELTDQRSSRRTHYLNDPVKLSAYIHYYFWWNLVRLVKLLQNIPLLLKDGDRAADFGTGPLTFICALWIAKPELRKQQLTWYCVDISHKALTIGEELFLSLCSYTTRNFDKDEKPWHIKKIGGSFGVLLKEKVALVTEANMFNELFWNNPLPVEVQAKKTHETLMQYLKPDGSVLLIEPGIPLAGEFLSMLRTLFLQSGFSVPQPCPHAGACCFPYRKQHSEHSGKHTAVPIAAGKWCHFTFMTDDSPPQLLSLSQAARLGKEKASLSFLYCSAAKAQQSVSAEQSAIVGTDDIPARICSDIITPVPQIIGRYACSKYGFMLITTPAYRESVLNKAVSGSLLFIPEQQFISGKRDKKTGAVLVEL